MRILIVSGDFSVYGDEFDISGNVTKLLTLHKQSNNSKQFEIKEFFKDYKPDPKNEYTELKRVILEEKFDIFHFSVHRINNKITISEFTTNISLSEFSALFPVSKKTRTSIFNICESETIGDEVHAKNFHVLSWSIKPGNTSMELASECFYQNLFAGKSIIDSFKAVTETFQLKGREQEQPVVPPVIKTIIPPDPPEKVKYLWLFLLLAFIVLLFAWWGISPINRNRETKHGDNALIMKHIPASARENIKIKYPSENTGLKKWDTLCVESGNLKPWIFIYSQKKKRWVIQPEGKRNEVAEGEWFFIPELSDSDNDSNTSTFIVAIGMDDQGSALCKKLADASDRSVDENTFSERYNKGVADTLSVVIQ